MSTTRDNTTQHEYETRQRDTTQIKHDTARVKYDTTRSQHDSTRVNTSTKEARKAKIGLYFSPFVTELYTFLIQSRFKSRSFGLHVFFAIFWK